MNKESSAINNVINALDITATGIDAVADGVEVVGDITDAAETGGGVLSGISDCFDEDFLPAVAIVGAVLAIAGIVGGIVKFVKAIKKKR